MSRLIPTTLWKAVSVLLVIANLSVTAAEIPFVGCPSDGQAGPRPAPTGKSMVLDVNESVARQLAYYEVETGVGVLGPRGWHCFGTYGSGGTHLMLRAEPLDGNLFFGERKWLGFEGPAIQFSYVFGGTSGRLRVAQIIERLFPGYISKASELLGPDSFQRDPHPGPSLPDVITHLGPALLEYRTPSNRKGLGTDSHLLPNAGPIEGVIALVVQTPDALVDQTPDVIYLAVRLPEAWRPIQRLIIQQVEAATKPKLLK